VRGHDAAAGAQAAVAAVRAPHPLVTRIARHCEVAALMGAQVQRRRALHPLCRAVHVLALV